MSVNKNVLIFILLLLLGGVSTSGMWWWQEKEKAALRSDLEAHMASDKESYASTTAALTKEKEGLEKKIEELSTTISDLTDARDGLAVSLGEEKDKVGAIQKQVSGAIQTVGVLDKLSKTDTELLQKYSKVSFLNEHYIPTKLAPIKKEYVYDESHAHELHAQAMPFFEGMVQAALEDNVKLFVSSSYRSFGEQGALKSAYSVSYGSGANRFSADQGYSEHQLGTAIDFTTTGIGGGIDGFASTPAYTWMTENAYKYGFILSYPKGNTYYIFEPWHWRFVGVKLARKLHSGGKHFYDMDQREINNYLISIFD